MLMVARVVVAIAVCVTAAASAAADAGAAMRAVDVPGVSGRSVQIAAAGRLADGGAIVVGTLTPGGSRRARPRIVVMRLRHDGLIDTSYGSSGIVTVQLARGDGKTGTHATSIAVDPATGRAWIGASIGARGAGAVLALHGHGGRLTHFGSNAVVRFDGDATAPTALAYDGRRLVVAATRRPCQGCQVLLIDPASGARRGKLALAPVPDGDAGRCPGAVLGSLALVGTDRLVLGGSGGSGSSGGSGGSGGDDCPARLVVRDGLLRPVAIWDPGDGAQRTVVTEAGPPLDLCVGIEREGAVRLVRVAAGAAGPAAVTLPKPTWTPVAGTLAGVVPLGDHACGALLRSAGKPARVVQAANDDAKPAVTEVPAGLRAGAIYRCKQHVLVVGTRHIGGGDRASVAVSRITRR